jgi:YHS domain-containing protein
MNRPLVCLSAAAVLCLAGFSLAQEMPGMDMPAKAPTSQPAADASAVDLGNTVCPVSGDKVGDSKLTATYEGKLYHFCCDDCPKKFAKDPATYAKAVAADPAKYGVKSKP